MLPESYLASLIIPIDYPDSPALNPLRWGIIYASKKRGKMFSVGALLPLFD
jgi:hypothetical protein